MCLWCINYE